MPAVAVHCPDARKYPLDRNGSKVHTVGEGEHMRTICIASVKGGVGKTSLAVNLGAALAERRRRVLVVDTDPQGAASAWLGVRDTTEGLLNVLTDGADMAPLVRSTAVKGLDLVPSTRWLVKADRALSAETRTVPHLRNAIETVAGGYDYVLLDTAPNIGPTTVNALAAAGELMIPLEGHAAAVVGLAQLLETVDVVRERLNPGLALAGIVVCKARMRTRHTAAVVDMVRERHGKDVYKTVIPASIKVPESWSHAEPITSYDARGRVAEAFRALAREVIRQEPKGAKHGKG